MHIANGARQGRFLSPMHFDIIFMVSATFLNQSAIGDSIESNQSTICFIYNKLCYMQMTYALFVCVQQVCSKYFYNGSFFTSEDNKNVILIMCF